MQKIRLMVLIPLLCTGFSCTSVDESVSTAAIEPAATEQVKSKPAYITVKIPVLTKETRYLESSFVKSLKEYTYEDSRLVRITETDTYGDILETVTYEYDAQEKTGKISWLGPDNKIHRYTLREFDARGNIVRDYSFNNKNVRLTGNAYYYDSEGRRVRWEVLDAENRVISRTEYEFSANLNTRIINYDIAGVIREYYVIEYINQLPVKKTYYSDDGTIQGSETCIYDNGHEKERIFKNANGTVRRKELYTHDENGSVVKTEYLDTAGNVQETVGYEYIYREETRKGE